MRANPLAQTQRGLALITALLTMALATLIATHLLDRTQLALTSVASQHDYAQAQAMADSGVDYARSVLARDARASSIDHTGEAWATPLPPMKIESGEVGGVIEDLQGRWNLNNLTQGNGQPNPAALAVYRRLLLQLGLAANLADHLVAWMGAAQPDNRQASALPGAFYRPLTDPGNLSSVPGYDRASIERLRPYVMTVAGSQPVNVNTASALVLAALVPELALDAAESLVQARRRVPFRDVADFLARLPPRTDGSADTTMPVGVTSQHFGVRVSARVGSARATRYAILRRAGNAWPSVVMVSLT